MAIECLLTIKAVFHLAYRQTEGFANSLNALLEIDLLIPDDTTLGRRAKTLQVSVKATAKRAPIHVVVGSTGLKVYGEGEWKVRKHGYSKRRTWRKLHLAVDEAIWTENEGQAHPRNTNLRRIQEIGITEWKVECGYHRRSLAETAMFRFKAIFGDRLSAREKQRQKVEAAIK